MMNPAVIEGIAKIRQLGPDLEVSSYMVKIIDTPVKSPFYGQLRI